MMENMSYEYSEETHDWVYSVPKEFTKVVQDNFKAVLLVCDPEKGVPETFYIADASAGSNVYVNDSGQLVWEVQSIESADTDLPQYSYTAVCKVYGYTFDENGNLIGQTDTGKIERFCMIPGDSPDDEDNRQDIIVTE